MSVFMVKAVIPDELSISPPDTIFSLNSTVAPTTSLRLEGKSQAIDSSTAPTMCNIPAGSISTTEFTSGSGV